MPETKVTLEKGVEIEKQIEKTVVQAAAELKIEIPSARHASLGFRIITLLTLLGGLAIVGNVFADAYTFQPANPFLYILRLVMGLVLIVIAYFLNHRRFVSLWLLGIAVVVSLFSNIYIAVLPVLALAYLYIRRDLLEAKQVKLGPFTIKV